MIVVPDYAEGMEWDAALVYIACFGWFLGTLLVARVPLSPPSTGQRVGMVLLLLAFVASVCGLVLGVPGGPSLLLSNCVTALVCGFTLGFGVFRKQDGSVREIPRPVPPSRPLREEAPGFSQLMGGMFICWGFLFLASVGNRGSKASAENILWELAIAAFFLWLAWVFLILTSRWKLALGVGGGALALLIGVLLPPQTL